MFAVLFFLFVFVPTYVESIWSLLKLVVEDAAALKIGDFPLEYFYWITVPIALYFLIGIWINTRKKPSIAAPERLGPRVTVGHPYIEQRVVQEATGTSMIVNHAIIPFTNETTRDDAIVEGVVARLRYSRQNGAAVGSQRTGYWLDSDWRTVDISYFADARLVVCSAYQENRRDWFGLADERNESGLPELALTWFALPQETLVVDIELRGENFRDTYRALLEYNPYSDLTPPVLLSV